MWPYERTFSIFNFLRIIPDFLRICWFLLILKMDVHLFPEMLAYETFRSNFKMESPSPTGVSVLRVYFTSAQCMHKLYCIKLEMLGRLVVFLIIALSTNWYHTSKTQGFLQLSRSTHNQSFFLKSGLAWSKIPHQETALEPDFVINRFLIQFSM